MEVGRDFERLFKKLVDATERNAIASERLIELATEERTEEASIKTPGYCPHCGLGNPEIRNEGGAGRMDEFVLIARCGNCQGEFYGFPQGWTIAKTKEEARAMMEAGT